MFEALKNAIKTNPYIVGEEALSNPRPLAKFYFGCHDSSLYLKKLRICAQTVPKIVRGSKTAYIEA